MEAYKILAVEDNAMDAAILRKYIEKIEHFELLTIIDDGQEALKYFKLHNPDVVILDILLNGIWDGITTAEHMKAHKTTPIVFLTSLDDPATFEKAKQKIPYAFLSKPVEKLRLQQALELALEHAKQFSAWRPRDFAEEDFLVKVGNKFIRLRWEEIAWISVEGRHTCIHVDKNVKYELRIPLKELEDILPTSFLRIHRSAIINTKFLASYNSNTNEVTVKEEKFTVSRGFKDNLFKNLRLLG